MKIFGEWGHDQHYEWNFESGTLILFLDLGFFVCVYVCEYRGLQEERIGDEQQIISPLFPFFLFSPSLLHV